MNKNRIILFFIFLAVFTIIFQLGSMSTVSQVEADLFMEEFKKLVLDIDAFGIFVHNTTIALPMFIPGFGIFWGLFSSWSTGYAFAAIATSIPEVANISPLTILFLSPFGLMEISAYSLGISRSFILIKAIITKTNLLQFIKPTIIEIGIVITLLLAGGYIEFYMIELVENENLEMPGF
ncbi:MAG: stage II sporulation protein M [Nitrosopumilus sp.]|nr:stage II sporulation protein M [Nitrosopumilus sp.]MCH1519722.1 stage II sporulation protein M [Nitrosopumilus sp.]MDB4840714.1 stage II sporulation protein M [Nitrosopumilus sp.]